MTDIADAPRIGELVETSVIEETVQRLYGSEPEVRFDRVVLMATRYFAVPMGALALVQGDAVWLKSRIGFDIAEMELPGTFAQLVTSGSEPVVVVDATTDPRVSDSMRATGIRFFAGAPLIAPGGVTVGAFMIYDVEPRASFAPEETARLVLVAEWLEEEIHKQQEHERAAAVQASLLPVTGVDVPGYEIAGACVPSRSVGGDFYDWYLTHDGLALTMADVMGKGVGSAIIAATVRAVLRGAGAGRSVLNTVARAADLLDQDLGGSGSFVTLFHGRLRPIDGTIRYVDAGHGLSLVLRSDGSTQRLSSSDLPLGTGLTDQWTRHQVLLAPGDTLAVFSDGVLDLYDGSLAAVDRVAELIRSAESPEAAVASVAALAKAATDIDDVTIVILRRKENGA
jgi:hypothetical protein